MKFIFDFDGVMTDQTAEARRVAQIFVDTLKARCGLPSIRIEAMLERAYHEIRRSPHSHGWRDQGRVSAYANEDLFIETVGLASCLRELADSERGDFHLAREGLQQTDAPGYVNLSQYAYEKMVQETRQGHIQPVDPHMAPLLEKLLQKGHNVVVVSNSSTPRILDLLHKAGLKQAADHDININAPLRVRGNARKFDLGEHPRGFEVEGYRIDTSRPSYERIIREEKPQVVTGDVFSLDLSLPLHLARLEPETFGGMTLFLRTQAYTPNWTKNFFSTHKETSARLFMIADLREIPEKLVL